MIDRNMKRSYIFLATGFEEIEALATADVMRRAGMEVLLVSIYKNLAVTGANGITVEADMMVTDADFTDAEWLIVPGGMPGASNLHDDAEVNTILKKHAANGGRIAAICAAPAVVLAPLGLLKGLKATCYPGFEEALASGGADYQATERVVRDGNIITGNGPSSAILFGAAIVDHTLGTEAARTVTDGMLV